MEPAEAYDSISIKRLNADMGRKEAWQKALDLYSLIPFAKTPQEKDDIMRRATEQMKICHDFTQIVWECDDKLGRLE